VETRAILIGLETGCLWTRPARVAVVRGRALQRWGRSLRSPNITRSGGDTKTVIPPRCRQATCNGHGASGSFRRDVGTATDTLQTPTPSERVSPLTIH